MGNNISKENEMSKRWFRNFCAVCVVALYCVALLALNGCAMVDMTKTGADITWSSKTLWKDIKAVEAGTDSSDFNFSMGSSTNGMTAEQTQALLCLRDPTACK